MRTGTGGPRDPRNEKEETMSHQAPGRLPYDLHTITQNAPPLSGVYAIFSPSECLYVGASDDICASLLEIYYEDQPWLNDEYLAHFSFDLVSPDGRGARQTDRIRELQPVCNLRMGVSGGRSARNGTAEKAGGRRAGKLETKGNSPVLAFGGHLTEVGRAGPA